ncbi:MAG: lactonase family protein [Opitutaceae bacterium]|nr:lactonase family protein [Opitutaceae bacterium]
MSVLSLGLAFAILLPSVMCAASRQLIFIGTYTPREGASRGLYAVPFDPATGALGTPTVAAETPNPTFLALHPGRRVLYALGESGTVQGRPGGAVIAFALAPDGGLAPLNTEPTGGGSTTHLAADATGRMLIAVSYSGGQVASFPLAPDGRIGARIGWQLPAGKPGPNPARQDRPHPHSVTLSPDNRFAYVCDLGLDRIFRYRIDPATAALTADGAQPTAPGAGPRHGKISADGRFLHVINELAGTITTFVRDPVDGGLRPVQTVSTLPPGFAGENATAEIRLHPNERFLYGSNRGHDSLAVFARDPASGRLTPVEIVPSGGGHPRNFALSPDGAWLVCANRDSGNLVVFRVDPATGRLTRTPHTAAVPQAVCVLFGPAGS